VEKDQFTAVVDTYGARRQVSLMLLPEEVQVGDYVLVHAGFAIQKVQPQAAQEALGLIEELLERLEEEEPQG
jgi:hydrogenase expression/formation protein HypC